MKLVSLCMMVKNEETILEKCLQSISGIPDEIIIVDTGSTDRTKKIAKKYANKTLDFEWIDDASAVRNFCEQHATAKYIMTWDADWILDKSSLAFLQNLKKDKMYNIDLIDGNWHVELAANLTPIKSLHRVVFYKRGSFHWEYPIHEKLIPNSKSTSQKGRYFPEIEIIHAKDPVVKAARYDQTNSIIAKLIEANNCPPHILFAYGENLLFQKKYNIAEETFLDFLDKYSDDDETSTLMAIEKLMQIYLETERINKLPELINKYKSKYEKSPRFVLTMADSLAVNNLLAAEKEYERFLKNPVNKATTSRLYDSERFEVHPKLMLAKIYFISDKVDQAEKLLKEVISTTNILSTKNKAELILKQISND